MREFFTEALVLDKLESNEYDFIADLFTRDLGRVKARVKSGRKILSKLSPHLEPLTVSEVRLVEKAGLIVADALTVKRFNRGFKVLNLLKSLVQSGEADQHLWFAAVQTLTEGEVDLSNILKVLGYDPAFVSCFACQNPKASAFFPEDQSFFCARCSSKIPENKLVYL